MTPAPVDLSSSRHYLPAEGEQRPFLGPEATASTTNYTGTSMDRKPSRNHLAPQALPEDSNIASSDGESLVGRKLSYQIKSSCTESYNTEKKYSSDKFCYNHLYNFLSPFNRQFLAVLIACMSGTATGAIHAFSAVALPRWEDPLSLNLSTTQSSWFASMPMLVGLVLCVPAGLLMDRFGTHICLKLCLPIFSMTWCILAMSEDFWLLLLARALQGLVASFYMVVITVYPAEVCSSNKRGMMVGLSEASVMLGALVTYLLGMILSNQKMAFALISITALQGLSFSFMPQSPVWLTKKGRTEEAKEALLWLHGDDSQTYPNVETENNNGSPTLQQFKLLKKKEYAYPLFLCIIVLLFKELTGQFAVTLYTVKIFELSGTTMDPYLCTVIMGVARFVPCMISYMLIERISRKFLLVTCLTISSIAIAVLGLCLILNENQIIDTTHLSWLPLTCLLVFVVAFGSGVGPNAWTLVAEMLPTQIRLLGGGIINTLFCVLLFLVGVTFPHIVALIGIGGCFLIYSGCTIVGALFVITCIPETRGRSFDEIQASLNN
ncbi:unnamed protein product, partial [Meganyctiphanes norvegica]